jgi:hypothetical protein
VRVTDFPAREAEARGNSQPCERLNNEEEPRDRLPPVVLGEKS